ncbi:MAG: hypothetical protein J7621_18945 [Niastella sp.]|nr:hypothetical protein [Niastella sp.]
MIETGEIVEFSQIFDYIPVRVVVDDIKSSSRRFSRLKISPDELELQEMCSLGKQIGVDMDVIYALSKKQFLSTEVKVAKKKKK